MFITRNGRVEKANFLTTDYGNRMIECDNGISNVRLLRRWKNGDGFQKKAYEILKSEIPYIDKESLKGYSRRELLYTLYGFRHGITLSNKKPKPRWIHA